MPERTNREKLSSREVEGMKQNLQRLEEMERSTKNLNETDFAPADLEAVVVDKAKIRSQIRQIKQQLQDFSPRKITDPRQRDKLVKARKELERRFVPYLETYTDLRVRRRNDPNWHSAFVKATERPKVDPLIRKWKQYGLMLEPDDPTINDLDKLRAIK